MNDYINKFYNNPTEITDKEKVIKIIHHYKTQILENNYFLYIANNEIVVKLFILFLYYYDLNLVKGKKNHCAIDYEFSTDRERKVALMQINFPGSNQNYLWIIDPKKYDKKKIGIINNLLLLNDKIYKVLHGSESLDIPYMYNILFDNNKSKIIKFTNKLIDTRFLCEYVRKSLGEEGRCSIYDAFLYFGTINKEKYDYLQKVNDKMGPIQYVNWEIEKLSDYHIKYAMYDVLNLVTLVYDIFEKILDHTPTYARTYYYIIKIIRFVILERKNVTDVLEFSKRTVNEMNNYIVDHNNDKSTLLDIYNNIIENCVLYENDDKIYVNFIETVSYIKGTFNFLLKYITFYVLSNKYKVYKNKNELMDNEINIGQLYAKINDINFKSLVKLLKIFEKYVENYKL